MPPLPAWFRGRADVVRFMAERMWTTPWRLVPVTANGQLAFARDDDTVYHTYSAYARGGDATWAMRQWLDRAPLGRNEGDMSWFHRHDEYPA
jgi:predicted dithiol-disulfide oxidoreductase (DUF899 family)